MLERHLQFIWEKSDVDISVYRFVCSPFSVLYWPSGSCGYGTECRSSDSRSGLPTTVGCTRQIQYKPILTPWMDQYVNNDSYTTNGIKDKTFNGGKITANGNFGTKLQHDINPTLSARYQFGEDTVRYYLHCIQIFIVLHVNLVNYYLCEFSVQLFLMLSSCCFLWGKTACTFCIRRFTNSETLASIICDTSSLVYK
jgi:hypothetical protein